MTPEAVFHALLRTHLSYFIQKTFQTIGSGQYVHNWHIDAIAHELSLCGPGEAHRLLITQPPRSLKSISTSVAYVAWMLGRDPSLKFACVSYSQDLAVEFSRQFRKVIESTWYREVFPGVRFERINDTECKTTAGGGRLATSIGGTLTGLGASIIIIDDPMKAEDAQSEAVRAKVIDWFSGTLTTRINDKRKGSVVIVMQRLHEDDLAGHVLRSGDFRHLDLPAIAIDDQDIAIGDGKVHHRKVGEALQPVREPLEVLERLRKDLGDLRFSAQYQQRPVPLEGNLIKREWFRTYDTVPTGSGVQVIQSWDIATSTRDVADYSVCVTVAKQGRRLFVVDVFRDRLNYPNLKRKVVDLARDHGTQSLLIEKAGPGDPLVQELRTSPEAGCPTPIGIPPSGDKLVRMEAASSMIEGGDVFLPSDAPWLAGFLNELLAFPNGRHDDQVDAFSQLLNWVRRQSHRSRIAVHGVELIELD